MTISDKVMCMGEVDAPEPDIWMVEGHPSSALSTVLDSARDYATASRSDARYSQPAKGSIFAEKSAADRSWLASMASTSHSVQKD